jgi:hypothetical protein
MSNILDFWTLLVVALGNWITRMITSAFIMKLAVAGAVYAFLFTVIPLLIIFLVPSSIMNAFGGYVTMLQTNQWSEGIAYVLGWVQFGTLLGCVLPALAVRFLFRRI